MLEFNKEQLLFIVNNEMKHSSGDELSRIFEILFTDKICNESEKNEFEIENIHEYKEFTNQKEENIIEPIPF